ncbi:hypothetical protein Tco_0999515, partial [Tanacetum coccineum]
PSSSNGPSVMERNADYAEELAKLQRQEYEAKDAAARYGYLFSQATAEILCQAEAKIRNQGVSAVRDPAGIDSAVRDPAGIVSVVRDPASIDSAVRDPAGIDPAALGDPAASTSVSADFIPVHADESTLPPGQNPLIFVAAGYLVSAGTCFCCYSILLLREDLSRNLELTESKPIINVVPADSSSSHSQLIIILLGQVQEAILLIKFSLVMFSFQLTDIDTADCYL